MNKTFLSSPKSSLKSQLKKLAVQWGVIATTLLTSLSGQILPASAAESVIVRKGFISFSVPVKDLKTFVETQKPPLSLLGIYGLLSNEQKQALLTALSIKLDISKETVETVVNSEIGDEILENFDTIMVSKNKSQNNTLKQAILAAAQDPKGLSILGFLEAYPLPEIDVDINQAFQVVGSLNQEFWLTQKLFLEILPQGNPGNPQPVPIPFDPMQPGSGNVQITRLEFNDSQRDRKIPVYLYWSSEITPDKPLILYSHGRGSTYEELRYLMEHLASHGYMVVVPEHPGSNAAYLEREIFISPQEFLDRPKDLMFVLDELEKLNITDPTFKGKFNTQNTMMIGYSFGGGTALTMAGGELQIDEVRKNCQDSFITLSLGKVTQCLAGELPENRYRFTDPRIKSAIAFAPTASTLFGKTGLNKVEIPTLIVTESADKVTPALPEQLAIFPQIQTQKWLVGVLGATHLSVRDPRTIADQSRVPSTPVSGNEVIAEASQDVRNYAKAVALAMAKQLTPDAEQYKIFLTPEYFQSISTSKFPVRLFSDIPPETQALIQQLAQQNQ